MLSGGGVHAAPPAPPTPADPVVTAVVVVAVALRDVVVAPPVLEAPPALPELCIPPPPCAEHAAPSAKSAIIPSRLESKPAMVCSLSSRLYQEITASRTARTPGSDPRAGACRTRGR